MSKTVSQVIASALVRHGVEFIFGQSNPTALMLAAEAAGIRQLLYRTENAAGAMADAYARTSNKIGVLAAQNGPAATLCVAPMAEAYTASLPMLVLVQEVPASQRDKNAFQELDHFALFEGVSKWVRRLDDPQRAEEYVDLAMIAANSGRPGPVVLLLAKDVLMEEVLEGRSERAQNLGYFPLDRPRPESDKVEEAVRLLASASAPLIIAGGGVHSSGACKALEELVEAAHLPVATTNMGKGSIAETHDYSLGVAGSTVGEKGPAYEYKDLIFDADVVLFVGTRTNENGTDSWSLTSQNAKYIHIDTDPNEISRNYESVRLLGDARSALEDLKAKFSEVDISIREKASSGLRKKIKEGRQNREESIEAQLTSNVRPILPQRLMGEMNSLIGPNDIVVSDASYSSFWVTNFLTAKTTGQRFLVPRGLAGLGWGLPYAIGAKIARPDGRVIGVAGDGGFAHVWGEVEMAVRENVPVTLIVLNNSQLAMQRHGELLGFGKTTTGIEFCTVDHAAIARSVGAMGIRIEDPSDFRPALEEALSSDQVTLLDVITDPNAYAPLRIFEAMKVGIDTLPTVNNYTRVVRDAG